MATKENSDAPKRRLQNREFEKEILARLEKDIISKKETPSAPAERKEDTPEPKGKTAKTRESAVRVPIYFFHWLIRWSYRIFIGWWWPWKPRPSEDTTTTEEETTPPPEETTPPPEETTTTTTKDEECVAVIEGPECVCIDDVHEYMVTSVNCPGGSCQNWQIDEPAIASIIQTQNCTVKVLVLSEGPFYISCDYTRYGQRLHLSRKIRAYGVKHVLGGTTDSVVVTAPLIQPHPFVQITSPVETSGDECLSDNYYKVHREKLEDGFDLYRDSIIDLQKFIDDYFEVELKVSGTISDFFQETIGCAWSINQEDLVALIKTEEFTDTSFETKIPGEQNMNNRVILLKGMGEFTVKIIADNAISRAGTDWITMFITFSRSTINQIKRLKEDLAALIINAGTNPHPGHASAILNKQNEIKAAYYEGLKSPCLKCSVNDQEVQAFALTISDQTRTQGKDDDRAGDTRPAIVVSESAAITDEHTTELKKTGATLFITEEPVKQFWVTKDSYIGTLYNWDEDGLLRGDMGGTLTSKFQCCDDVIPVFGVEMDMDDCFVVRSDGTVTLKAKGIPTADPGGNPGKYLWSVIAKPDPDAVATVTPADWTPAPSAALKVDTSGIYTVKVMYQLGGRVCQLTYAVKDIIINIEAASEVQWEIRRVGRYPQELAQHINRPYYQERKAEEVLAAEMLITPKASSVTYLTTGPTGIPAAPSTTSGTGHGDLIGKKFSGSFIIPPEISFGEELTLRAYHKPYNPALTDADYEDFTGAPYVTIDPLKPYEAMVNIISGKDIHAIHIMHITYRNVVALKGQAVPIHFVFWVPDAVSCKGEETTTETDDPYNEVIEITTEETDTETGRQDLLPLVNLLLYNRDLGEAVCSNGFQSLSHAGDSHNVPNGNVQLTIPVFSCQGHGENLDLAFSYNSLQASYQDSLELLQMLNNVSTEDVHAFYCNNPVGKGWTHSYNVYLRDYVKPTNFTGLVLEQYMELVCPDGNRIQFVLRRPPQDTGDDGSGGPTAAGSGGVQYIHEYMSDHWRGNAETALALQLTGAPNAQGDMEYELTNLYGKKWKFDKFRNLVEITTRLIENSPALKTVRLQHTGDRLKITDSRDRELVLEAIPHEAVFTGMKIFNSPDGKTTLLDFVQGRLNQLWVAQWQQWFFEYYDDLKPVGAPHPGSFLRSVKDPREVTNLYAYYEGKEFAGVSEVVAKDFWGRLGKVVKGINPESREHLWRYKRHNTVRQEVVYRNPANVEFQYDYQLKEMAIVKSAYVRQVKDDTSMALTGTPNYTEVLAGTLGSLPLVVTEEITYHKDTKLVEIHKDLHSNESKFTYEPILNDSAYLLKTKLQPDNTVISYDYDSRHLLEKIFNPKNNQDSNPAPFTKFIYDSAGNIKSKENPVLDGDSSSIIEVSAYDLQTSQLLTYQDVEGVVTTYRYGEDNRDPDNSGLPTSRTVTLSKGRTTSVTLTWEMTYNKMGKLTKTYDPTFGTNTAFHYHTMGPMEKVTLQKIKTETGSEYSSEIIMSYDRLLSKTSEMEGGKSENWEYNDFGEVITYTDPAANKATRDYYGSGSLKEVSALNNTKVEYVVDELDRVVRTNYPIPDVRTGALRSQIFADACFYLNDIVTEKRYLINSPGVKLENSAVKRTIERKYRHGRISEEKETFAGGGEEIKRKFDYDAWGEEKDISVLSGNALKHSLVIQRDTWGRERLHTETSEGGAREIKTVLFASGRVKENIAPSFSTHVPGGTAKTSYAYDELGRLLEVKDGYDNVVKKTEYYDFGNNGSDADLASRVAKTIDYSQDPSKASGQGGLIVSREAEFNRRGLDTETYLGSSRSLEWKQSKKYDVYGRVVEKTDENGRVEAFVMNWDNTPSVVTLKYKQRKFGVDWKDFNKSNNAHVEDKESVALYDYAENGELKRLYQDNNEETYTYDAFGRVIEIYKTRLGTEKLTYDIFDQVTRKELGNGSTATFAYSRANREVEATYRNAIEVKTKYTYDWDHKLKEFQYMRNRGSELNMFQEGYKIKFDYSAFGKLQKKEYYKNGNQLSASLEYGHNAAGLRTRMDVKLSPQGRPAFSRRVDYGYDVNMRLVFLDAGPFEKFQFKYNHAGFLKKLSRPQSGVADDALANTTGYEHDENGRIVKMTEGKGKESDNRKHAELDLYYQPRQKENWEKTAEWETAGKSMVTDTSPVLKGLAYRRFFAENIIPAATRDKYTQDYIYNGHGLVDAAVTQWISYPDVFVDSRYADTNPIQTSTKLVRNYKTYGWPATAASENINHSVEEKRVFGNPAIVYKREGKRDPWAPPLEPKGYVENLSYNSQTQGLHKREMAEESISILVQPPVASPQQNHRRFIHDALGRLVFMGDRTDLRTNFFQGDLEPETVNDQQRQSFEFKTKILYDPDGQEILLETLGNGIPGGRDETLILRDGPEKVAEYKSSFDELTYYVNVPGLNLRLCVNTMDRNNNPVTDTMYYRWDHKGTTLFTTNFQGDVVTDYRYGSHDGQRDLFGRTIGPGGLGAPETQRRKLAVLWSYFQPSSARLDRLVSQSHQLVDRSEEITAKGLHPTQLSGGKNNYGYSVGHPHIWIATALPAPELTDTQSIIQGVIDFNRGFWDTVSFGVTKDVREWWTYESQPLNAHAYLGGTGVGIVASIATGVGVAVLARMGQTATLAYRLLNAYMKAW